MSFMANASSLQPAYIVLLSEYLPMLATEASQVAEMCVGRIFEGLSANTGCFTSSSLTAHTQNPYLLFSSR